MEQQLMARGGSTSPVQSPMEGIARALSGVAGGYFAGQGERDLKEKEAAYSGNMAAMTKALVGGQPIARPAPGFVGPMGQTKGGIPAALATLPQGAEYDSVRNQLGMQMYNDKRNAAATQAARAQQLGDEARKRRFDVADREDAQNAATDLQNSKPDKFGNGYVGADPKSPTGFSRYQVNGAGETRNLGPVAGPRANFDPDAASKVATSKGLSSRYETSTNDLREADSILVNVQQMLELVGKVDSGKFAETKMEIAGAMRSLGFDIDERSLATAQAMRSKGMDFILQRIAKTKGAISEKEMDAFKKASASLENTPEGNRMILALAAKVAERNKYVATAEREAYGRGGDMSVVEYDNIGINARKEWDEKFGGLSVAFKNDTELTKEQEDLVNRNLPKVQ
tara:strand:- start:2688 stop:3881 length:1194 start_codon:yes stop_codon:yes gene_type:complete